MRQHQEAHENHRRQYVKNSKRCCLRNAVKNSSWHVSQHPRVNPEKPRAIMKKIGARQNTAQTATYAFYKHGEVIASALEPGIALSGTFTFQPIPTNSPSRTFAVAHALPSNSAKAFIIHTQASQTVAPARRLHLHCKRQFRKSAVRRFSHFAPLVSSRSHAFRPDCLRFAFVVAS